MPGHARVHLAGAARRRARRARDRRVVGRRPALGGARRPPPVRRRAVPRAREADRARRSVARRPRGPTCRSRSSGSSTRALAVDPAQAAARGASSRRRSGARRPADAARRRAPALRPRAAPRFRRSSPQRHPPSLAALLRGLDASTLAVLPRVLAVRARSAGRRSSRSRPAARPRLRPRRARSCRSGTSRSGSRSSTCGSPLRVVRAVLGAPARGLLFVAGPLLAPLGALAPAARWSCCPLGGAVRRAAQAAAAVLAAAVVAALAGTPLPFVGGDAPDLSLAGIGGPFGAARPALARHWPRPARCSSRRCALAPPRPPSARCRRRGPWGGALFGALLAASTLLVDPGAPRCRSSPPPGSRRSRSRVEPGPPAGRSSAARVCGELPLRPRLRPWPGARTRRAGNSLA